MQKDDKNNSIQATSTKAACDLVPEFDMFAQSRGVTYETSKKEYFLFFFIFIFKILFSNFISINRKIMYSCDRFGF